MNITIIGTGKMARGIAGRILAGGNYVTLIGRNKSKADQIAQTLTAAASSGSSARSGISGTPEPADAVVLAVPYSAAAQVIRDYRSQITGKILIDITNPFTESYDDLVTPPGSSAAEELARELPPGTKIVKAFNTTFAATLVKGEVGGQPLDIFVAGDDAQAKKTVMGLIEASKMKPIDAGPLKRARQLEHLALLEVLLQDTLGTNYQSAIKILF